MYRYVQIKNSPFCSQSDRGGSQDESPSHCLSTCPKFHHAKTGTHNQVCKVLATWLCKYLVHWSPNHETPLSQTGLVLQLYCNQVGKSRIQTPRQYKWVLTDCNLILSISYFNNEILPLTDYSWRKYIGTKSGEVPFCWSSAGQVHTIVAEIQWSRCSGETHL